LPKTKRAKGESPGAALCCSAGVCSSAGMVSREKMSYFPWELHWGPQQGQGSPTLCDSRARLRSFGAPKGRAVSAAGSDRKVCLRPGTRAPAPTGRACWWCGGRGLHLWVREPRRDPALGEAAPSCTPARSLLGSVESYVEA